MTYPVGAGGPISHPLIRRMLLGAPLFQLAAHICAVQCNIRQKRNVDHGARLHSIMAIRVGVGDTDKKKKKTMRMKVVIHTEKYNRGGRTDDPKILDSQPAPEHAGHDPSLPYLPVVACVYRPRDKVMVLSLLPHRGCYELLPTDESVDENHELLPTLHGWRAQCLLREPQNTGSVATCCYDSLPTNLRDSNPNVE